MNWEALGALAEFAGAIGVIATLVYLSMQIRHSTRMMRVTVKQEQTSITHRINEMALANSDVYLKAVAGGELTEKEQFEFSVIVRATLRGWESYCYMRDSGLLDDKEWEGIQRAMARFAISSAFVREYEDMKPEMSSRLQSVLDDIMENGQGVIRQNEGAT